MRHVKQLIMIFLMIPMIAVCAYAGDLEPPAGIIPFSTMKTLDEIPPSWHQILVSSERFETVMGGDAVLDKETGLVWARNANLDGRKTWEEAGRYCTNVVIGNRKGWRLPTVEELSSLLDMSIPGDLKVPSGVFENVENVDDWFWSNTPYTTLSQSVVLQVWGVSMRDGGTGSANMNSSGYVWPVRGGYGPLPRTQ